MDAIKRKIRSLLALAAPNSGATDAERATARRLAGRLMRKHGLKEQDIPQRQVEAPRPRRVYRPIQPTTVVVSDFFKATWGPDDTTTGSSFF